MIDMGHDRLWFSKTIKCFGCDAEILKADVYIHVMDGRAVGLCQACSNYVWKGGDKK